MKYKIEEIEFADGHKEYLPLVKKHWWSRWKRVVIGNVLIRYDETTGTSYDYAESLLDRFIEDIDSKTVKHKRNIDYLRENKSI